jgi:hypothetical protein
MNIGLWTLQHYTNKAAYIYIHEYLGTNFSVPSCNVLFFPFHFRFFALFIHFISFVVVQILYFSVLFYFWFHLLQPKSLFL